MSSSKAPAGKAADPAKSDDASSENPPTKKGKVEVLSERKYPDGKVVKVVTDGKRVWKEAPEDSGMGPLA